MQIAAQEEETLRSINAGKTAREVNILLGSRESMQNPSWISCPNTGNTSIRSYTPLEIAADHNTQIQISYSDIHFFFIISENSNSLPGFLKLLIEVPSFSVLQALQLVCSPGILHLVIPRNNLLDMITTDNVQRSSTYLCLGLPQHISTEKCKIAASKINSEVADT